ncbi:MAG TPA: type II toxin-antitoxin system RelE/ParE family toxin [Verrucomicrobiae bacterium]|nr:type II toxin-antitoxin system RelE/ParE family toxin [Verrucomicrobiae bacterium]
MSWEIEYYKTSTGNEVVKDFIDKLPKIPSTKLGRQLDLLEEFGSDLGMPHVKSLGDGLLELRVRGKQEVRVFYAFVVGRKIILLHGFIKKTQETPKKELDIARRRQSEVM